MRAHTQEIPMAVLVGGNNKVVGFLMPDGTRQPIPTWNSAGTALEDPDGTALATQRAIGTGGIGYQTGDGGAVTQITSRATGVTLSTLAGTITTHTASLAAGASAIFTVTNTKVAIGDVVVVSQRSGSSNVAGVAGTTYVNVVTVAAGSFKIAVDNRSSTTAETGAIIINFAVIKSVSA